VNSPEVMVEEAVERKPERVERPVTPRVEERVVAPDAESVPTLAVCAKRLVELAVVEKRLVVVALVSVALVAPSVVPDTLSALTPEPEKELPVIEAFEIAAPSRRSILLDWAMTW
jgi:hypothetical protein